MATQQVVNVGTQANDATGDLLRDAFTKINNNFAVFFAGNFPTAQMTVGPPVSGNALTAVGISGSAAIVATAFSVTDISLTATGTASFAGGVTFGSPIGGNKGAGSFNAVSGFINNVAIATGTTVSSFTSNTGLSTNVAATGAVTVTNTGVVSLAGTANQIAASASTGAVTLSLPSAVTMPGTLNVTGTFTSKGITDNGAAATNITISSAGLVTMQASAGANTLILNGTGSGNEVLQINQATDTRVGFYESSTEIGFIQAVSNRFGIFAVGASTTIALVVNSGISTIFSATGNVTMNAPSSGDLLTLTNVAGANALTLAGNSAGTAVLRLNTQATTGAQTATFTATNKPGSGTTGPDKWIPINLDGTTHYVPAFL